MIGRWKVRLPAAFVCLYVCVSVFCMVCIVIKVSVWVSGGVMCHQPVEGLAACSCFFGNQVNEICFFCP